MNRLLRRGGILWLVFLVCAPLLHAQRSAAVRKIEIHHVGPPAVSDSLVRANIRVREGEPYSRNSVDDDVRSLYNTGYFYNIRVDEEQTDEGVILTYNVQGKPTLTQILFAGNKKYRTSKLKKKIASKVNEPLDERKLFNDALEIQKFYQKSGYQKTDVKYTKVVDDRMGRGTVTFEITEAPKVKIQDVQFIGAQAFSQAKLRRTIKTRRLWMFSWLTGSGVLKDEQFDEDKERLAEFYRDEGYVDFEIKDVRFEQVSPKRMIIRLDTREGTRYRVGSVDLQGNKLFTTNEILSAIWSRQGDRYRMGLSMGIGELFTPKGLGRDREAIEDFYGSRGYIDAIVDPLRTANVEKGTMDITYRIVEGEQSHIEKIEIRGNYKTKDKVIRRELAVSPGEVFDMVRVKLSTNRLHGLDYFEKINAQPEPTDVVNGKNLVIDLEEKNTGEFRFGAGFSSLDSLMGFVEVGQGNFDLFKPPYFMGTGAGQKLRLRAQYGTRRQDYQLTFIEPWFMNRKLQLSVDLYHSEYNFYSDIYDWVESGVRLSLTRALWSDYWLATVSYTIESIGLVDMPSPYPITDTNGVQQMYDIVPAEIRLEQGHRLVSKVGTALTYDSRNSTRLPNRGQRTALLTEIAGGPLGGESDYYKIELSSSHYFRGFAPGHVLELSARSGVVDTYAEATRVPLFDRWFLGGITSLRGYKFRSVAPRDPAGTEPVGGNTYWFGYAEYSIPLIERLRLAAFYDIGSVYRKSYSFRTEPGYEPFSDDYGFGVRLVIPHIGPLRLDYAIPIHHDRFTSGNGRFQFSVGFTREYH